MNSFSHQAGIGQIQEAFPQIVLCYIRTQDMTSAPSEFHFHMRLIGKCADEAGKHPSGQAGVGSASWWECVFLSAKRHTGTERVWGCGLAYSPFLHIISNFFLILKAISFYFRMFRSYWLKKAQNKNQFYPPLRDLPLVNICVYPCHLFSKHFLNKSVIILCILFCKLEFNNLSETPFHINYPSPQSDF